MQVSVSIIMFVIGVMCCGYYCRYVTCKYLSESQIVENIEDAVILIKNGFLEYASSGVFIYALCSTLQFRELFSSADYMPLLIIACALLLYVALLLRFSMFSKDTAKSRHPALMDVLASLAVPLVLSFLILVLSSVVVLYAPQAFLVPTAVAVVAAFLLMAFRLIRISAKFAIIQPEKGNEHA